MFKAVTQSKRGDAIKGIAICEARFPFRILLEVKGGRDVAVNPVAMSLSYDDTTDKWNANVDATKQQIRTRRAAGSVQSKMQ